MGAPREAVLVGKAGGSSDCRGQAIGECYAVSRSVALFCAAECSGVEW